MVNAYPKIDRNNSGVIINGVLRPPGTYQVSPGTQVTIKARVHNTLSTGQIRVGFVINNTPHFVTDTLSAGQTKDYTYPLTINDYTEIYIETYYLTEEYYPVGYPIESPTTPYVRKWVKVDEYGCGGD